MWRSRIKQIAEISSGRWMAENRVPYNKKLATELHEEEWMKRLDFLVLLRTVCLSNRHLLENNWVMLERGERMRERLYTVYKDTLYHEGKIYMVHFHLDEHGMNYFDHLGYTAENMGYIFQLFLADKDIK
jgi:hypothetical protein